MKIRIKGNSVRYRLTRTDISKLSQKGYLEEKVNFGNATLIYALQRSGQKDLSSSFINNTITLFAPGQMIQEMKDTDKVGFETSTGVLQLLIEKDFTCLDNVTEDQSDNYPNPLIEKIL